MNEEKQNYWCKVLEDFHTRALALEQELSEWNDANLDAPKSSIKSLCNTFESPLFNSIWGLAVKVKQTLELIEDQLQSYVMELISEGKIESVKQLNSISSQVTRYKCEWLGFI